MLIVSGDNYMESGGIIYAMGEADYLKLAFNDQSEDNAVYPNYKNFKDYISTVYPRIENNGYIYLGIYNYDITVVKPINVIVLGYYTTDTSYTVAGQMLFRGSPELSISYSATIPASKTGYIHAVPVYLNPNSTCYLTNGTQPSQAGSITIPASSAHNLAYIWVGSGKLITRGPSNNYSLEYLSDSSKLVTYSGGSIYSYTKRRKKVSYQLQYMTSMDTVVANEIFGSGGMVFQSVYYDWMSTSENIEQTLLDDFDAPYRKFYKDILGVYQAPESLSFNTEVPGLFSTSISLEEA